MNDLVLAKDFGLNEKQGSNVELSFLPKVSEKEALTKMYVELINKEITPELCVQAGELGKKLMKVRTGIAKIHKVEKAVSLAYGRFVDALKNSHTLSIAQMESKLIEIKNYYINLEKEKQAKLKFERNLEVEKYGVDAEFLNLGLMNKNVWNDYIAGVKLNFEAKIKAEKEEEEKRLSEIAAEKERKEKERIENEKIRAENLRLQKEAAEKEALRIAELVKIEAENKRIADIEFEKQRKIQAEIERKAKKAADKAEAERKEAERLQEIERKKQAEILRIEQEKAETLRKAAADKAEAERKEKERKEKEYQKQLQAVDSVKFKYMIADLEKIKTKYEFKSDLNKKKYNDVNILIDKIINHIK